MAPMSEKTKAALDRLNKQIEAAESMLLRMPSSRMDECYLTVNREMSTHGSAESYLQLHSHMDGPGEEKEMLSVVHFENGEFTRAVPLSKLKVSERAQVAARIPELIAIAEQADSNLGKQIVEAADAIEQAVAAAQTKSSKTRRLGGSSKAQ